MKKNNIPEVVGVIVSLGGIIVMVGWFLNGDSIKSILPVWSSMNFSSALSFCLSGIVLYFIARFQKGHHELATIIIPITSMIIFLLMATLFASTIIGVNMGAEEIFVKDSMAAVKIVNQSRRSVVAMINFILMAMAGLLTILGINRLKKTVVIIGMTVAAIGLTAILGHGIRQPLLYFMIEGKSGAMTIYAAILFVAWSLGLIFVESDK